MKPAATPSGRKRGPKRAQGSGSAMARTSRSGGAKASPTASPKGSASCTASPTRDRDGLSVPTALASRDHRIAAAWP